MWRGAAAAWMFAGMHHLIRSSTLGSLLFVACVGEPSSPGDADSTDAATTTPADATGAAASSSSGAAASTGATGEGDASTGAAESSTPTTGGDETGAWPDTTGGAASVCGADPCRGDVVGAWTYDSFLCADPFMMAVDWCPGGVESTNVWNEGTLEFTGDGASVVHRRVVQRFRSVLPKQCVGGPCEAVFQGYTCSDDGVVCDCQQDFEGPWIDEVAAYTVEGHTLHVGEDDLDFCVAGDSLALIHLDLGEWTYLVRGE